MISIFLLCNNPKLFFSQPFQKTQNVLANVMPKKANWDLKRDVEKKMEKLEKRTQRAMVELMREEEERRMKEAEAEAEEAP